MSGFDMITMAAIAYGIVATIYQITMIVRER